VVCAIRRQRVGSVRQRSVHVAAAHELDQLLLV
jgi:hypothetical protein